MTLVDSLLDLLGSVRDSLWPRPYDRRIRELGLYPVFADWVGYFALTSSGDPRFTAHTELIDWEPLVEPDLRHVVFALASRRYRRFRELRPVRTGTAVVCPSCGGTGLYNLPLSQRRKLICQCGGTGWIEPAWLTKEYRAQFPSKEVV